MRIITLHPLEKMTGKFGYETSQLARQKVADMLNIEHLYITYRPQLIPNWKELAKNIGFKKNSMICLPNTFSDIADDIPSVTIEDLENKYTNKYVNQEGYVLAAENEKEIDFYSSGIYLKIDKKNNHLIWYNKDKSVALIGKKFNLTEPLPRDIREPGYLYFLNNETITEEELLIKYLVKELKQDDLIIRDQQRVIMPKLARYMTNTNKNYYEYIHANMFLEKKTNRKKRVKHLVASETFTEEVIEKLNMKAEFLAPIGVDIKENLEKTYENITDYCFVGNNTQVKQPEILIQAFIELYKRGSKAKVTIYGDTKNNHIKNVVEKLNPTPNIVFKGVVKRVPYKKHECYISTSWTELFANACVEAMSNGLVCLLSNVPNAHMYYAENNNSILTFDSVGELIDRVEFLENNKISNIDNLKRVTKYSYENLAKEYERLVKNENNSSYFS